MKKKFRSFAEARKFVRELKLKNRKNWDEYYKSGKKPEDIPASPWRIYKDEGWIGLWDWLGTDKPKNFKREYLQFNDARKIIHGFKIKRKDDWMNFLKSGKKSDEIPSVPERVYKNKGWKGWGDWLGTNRIANQNKKYWSFKESSLFVQKLNLDSREEFVNLVRENKLPKEIPNTPDHIYKKTRDWVSWGNFLGTGYVHPVEKSKNRLSFEDARKEARELAKKLNLKSWDDWIKAHKEGKLPYYFPQRPDKIYNEKKSKI